MRRTFDVPLPEGWSVVEAEACVGMTATVMTPRGVEAWVVARSRIDGWRLVIECDEPKGADAGHDGTRIHPT